MEINQVCWIYNSYILYNLSYQIELAVAVLESVKGYYKLGQTDTSRNGVTIRKIVLESVTGALIRKGGQLSQLADFLGARKKTVFECSKVRLATEEKGELIPLVTKLARKLPEGEKIISTEWKVKAGQFYEHVSEIIKGHHSVYKVGLLGIYVEYCQ